MKTPTPEAADAAAPSRGQHPQPGQAGSAVSPGYQHILLRRTHGVLFATLNRLETRHALAPEVVAELARVVGSAEDDPSVRALVLRGAGGFFCAGGNVGNFQSRLDAGPRAQGIAGPPQDALSPSGGGLGEARTWGLQDDPVAARNREFGHFMQRLAALPVPVIAVVEGAALGGGMGLACAADLVLATREAKFALSETALGILPAQIAPFVVERLGARAARRLGLFGERVSGEAARAIGLVDALADDGPALDALLAQWLTQLCACAPSANRALKPLLRRCGVDDTTTLLDDAAQHFAACMRDEGVEGIAAFREKRPATWRHTFSADEVYA